MLFMAAAYETDPRRSNAAAGSPADSDLLLGQLIRDGLDAANRGSARRPSARGN
jgi:hypothetical protein